jgi:hypothetical protein
MKGIDGLKQRADDIVTRAHADQVPTTTSTGERVWLKVGGSGLSFLRNLTKAMRDNTIPGDLRQQCELWARAEVDGSDFGEIARMNRTQARRAMGEE